MIQLYSLMWILAAFGAFIGFLRGWNREVVATAGILLGTFALFQFDAILRGTLLLGLQRDQAFVIQIGIFFAIVYFSYKNNLFEPANARARSKDQNIQAGILGGIVGAVNGYLVGGAIWYFLDISEYPFAPYVIAPAPLSPSAEAIGAIPLVIMSGGPAGSGDLFLVGVVIFIILVLLVV
jgi:hypothetical protein